MGTVAIIGGGKAGSLAAGMTRRLLGREHKVLLIEKQTLIYNRSQYPLLAAGFRYSGKRQITRNTSYNGVIRGAIETGRAVVPFSGDYYMGAASLCPMPLSRLWGWFGSWSAGKGS